MKNREEISGKMQEVQYLMNEMFGLQGNIYHSEECTCNTHCENGSEIDHCFGG